MFVLESHIKIGSFSFKSINEVVINKSVNELADTCVIKLPARFKIKDQGKEVFTENAIKAGDKVEVTLAYEGVYEGLEFVGYVKKIKPGTPVEIQCEDAMYLLRQKNITKAWENTTLKEVLQEVVSGTELELSNDIPGIELKDWIIKNANGTQVLEKLKQEFALTIFITDENKLYAGLSQLTNQAETAIYDLNYNIVQNDLEYRTAEDRKLKVKYTYIDENNEKTEVEVGDPDGEQRSFHTSVVSDPAKLKEMAEAEIGKLKYDGFDGSLTAFLVPFATRGMQARLIEDDKKNLDENYFIKSVETSFGMSGARRKVEIGQKL